MNKTEGTEAVHTCALARRLRLAVYCPRWDDGTSLVRALGPLGALERALRAGVYGAPVELELRRPMLSGDGLELTWDWLLPCDALLVQRPWLPYPHEQLCVQAKMMGLPLWVDFDDDYQTIHPSNPHYRQFMHERLGDTLMKIVRLADLVTVSTEEIRRRLVARHLGGRPANEQGKVKVLPNALAWPLSEGSARERRVSWRGGSSHEVDITSVLREMNELARLPQFGKWEWCFLGDTPWQVEQVMPRERCLGGFGAEPWLYMEALRRLRPYVHIVPLASNRFNPAKSNLAWLEATAAGAVVIAPELPEWRQPGIINYGDAKDFQEKLRATMEGYFGTEHGNVAVSREWIRQHLTLETVNAQRWEMLRELINNQTEDKRKEPKE